MILAALLIPVIAAFAGLAWGGAMVYGANQEGRRAADLAALNAAANLPTVNLTSCTTGICNPTQLPIENQIGQRLNNFNIDKNTAIPLPNNNWVSGGCYYAGEQLVQGNRSPVHNAYGNAFDCSTTPLYSQPWMQSLADCLAGISTVANCANTAQSALIQQLPLPAPGSSLDTQLAKVLTDAGMVGTRVTSTVATSIANLNNNAVVCLSVGQVPPCHAMDPLLTALGCTSSGGTWNCALQVNLANLAPALLTPEVKVDVQQSVRVPGAALVGFGNGVGVHNTSTARRVFKNAVLLPAFRPIPGNQYTTQFNALLSNAQADVVEAASRVDSTTLTPALNNIMQTYVCPSNPSSCQVNSAIGDEVTDLRDIFSPPANEPPPDGNQILRNAAQSGKPTLVATLQEVRDPVSILGSPLASLPAVQAVLGSGVLYAPALDFVPVTVQCPSDPSNCQVGNIVLTPVNLVTQAGQTQGLYKARLVD